MKETLEHVTDGTAIVQQPYPKDMQQVEGILLQPEDLSEIIGDICQSVIGFYGRLRTIQTRLPKTHRP